MNYELTLIPTGYQKHIKGKDAHCVHCDTKLDLIDQFLATEELPVEHEGLLYACSYCGANQLELLSSVTEFELPIVIGWD